MRSGEGRGGGIGDIFRSKTSNFKSHGFLILRYFGFLLTLQFKVRMRKEGLKEYLGQL
jgi:hypothetical protein